MPSKRWNVLRQQVEELREQFLPDTFDPLGLYVNAKRVQAQTRAFLVLTHAEIESFLEDWAKDIARASETIWRAKGKFTAPLVFLLCCLAERFELPVPPSGPTTKDTPQKLSDASVKLFQRYYKQIRDNNGIKEKNLLALFSPLGLPLSVIGSTLLPNLDNFGALRGTHAHQSAKAVVSVLDPETEYNRVTALLRELVSLDDWLTQYRRRIR